MATLTDSNFLDLARVATAATIHSPERAESMLQRVSEREQGLNSWISAAQADGRFKPVDPGFAANQIHALLKALAFWPQILRNAPPLSPEMQAVVIESTLDMFLGWYEIPVP